MNSLHRITAALHLPFVLSFCSTIVATLMVSGCTGTEHTLIYTGPTTGSGDKIFPDTPVGRQIKRHLTAMAGVGEGSEANYQKSLATMRADPDVTPILAEVYAAIPEEDYFRRTLVVEALKEMRSVDALPFLTRIASAPIPADRQPGNAEVNTRENEIVIRITAVGGISILAALDSREANDVLLGLISYDDLTVRQMAARGYLGSSIGSTDEKLKELREMVPQEEHWYLTTKLTNIRDVPHPDVLPEFNLEAFMKRQSEDGPRARER